MASKYWRVFGVTIAVDDDSRSEFYLFVIRLMWVFISTTRCIRKNIKNFVNAVVEGYRNIWKHGPTVNLSPEFVSSNCRIFWTEQLGFACILNAVVPLATSERANALTKFFRMHLVVEIKTHISEVAINRNSDSIFPSIFGSHREVDLEQCCQPQISKFPRSGQKIPRFS